MNRPARDEGCPHGGAPSDEDWASAQPDTEEQPLGDAVSNILEEARMILPGTQTLFGFQLIVVFNSAFQDRLSAPERWLHLVATALVAVATALLLAPAAYHRRVEPRSVSQRFVALSTRLLAWSLIPLMLAVCADFYLVATLVTRRWAVSLALALGLLAVFVWLWVLRPARERGDRRR
jgi:hypothetical protein